MKLSFEDILEQYNDILYKVARSYAYEEYEDIYQEIAIQLWNSYDSFKGESKLSTWIYRVALNTALSYKTRKPKIDYRIFEISLDQPDNSAKLDQLYKAINQLKATYRSLIILQLEGYDYEEISEILGISKTLVGVKLGRAKTKLKSLIKQY